jgi:hypothetical protein
VTEDPPSATKEKKSGKTKKRGSVDMETDDLEIKKPAL